MILSGSKNSLAGVIIPPRAILHPLHSSLTPHTSRPEYILISLRHSGGMGSPASHFSTSLTDLKQSLAVSAFDNPHSKRLKIEFLVVFRLIVFKLPNCHLAVTR